MAHLELTVVDWTNEPGKIAEDRSGSAKKAQVKAYM